ncbi:MAG: redoxin domain-containing protein [Alteromonadaceae bacterium]|nr:redoxin domain-containing protein [Alteromonadaceae bacterium]
MNGTAKFISTILTIFVIGFIFRVEIRDFIYFDLVTSDMFVTADSDNFDPGLRVGSTFPAISARYKGEVITEIDQFKKQKGVILIASRSYDWCPYCMKQLIQLQQYKAQFERAGIGLVAITYDSQEQQQAFTDKHSISIPVLSDIEASSFTALDILHADYPKEDEHYGLPYPGMFVVENNGVIKGKLFVETYSSRVDAESTLVLARSVL